MSLPWKIVDSLFNETGLINHQIESFDNFVEFQLQKIIDEVGNIEVSENCLLKFNDVKISKVMNYESDGVGDIIMPKEASN